MTPPVDQRRWLSELQKLIANRLDESSLAGRSLTAILGDAPSTYAKSPRLWNAAFEGLKLPARYLPLDIPPGKLPGVVRLLRENPSFLGGSVTVPYKIEILKLLDEVDPLASKIGAVNTLFRTEQGGLVGTNTDGLGGVQGIVSPLHSGETPLLASLRGLQVVLMGCGGAAQALAFFLAQEIGKEGAITVSNRNLNRASELCERINASGLTKATAMGENRLRPPLLSADLILNATTKGQAGWRRVGEGWTSLEPYSAVSPAEPSVISGEVTDEGERRRLWLERSRGDIERNQKESAELLAQVPVRTACCDIIYAPLETVFLRHARMSGHPTLNGKAMNILQAAEAFCRYTCKGLLQKEGFEGPKILQRVSQIMEEVW
ncbi:MAG: hypothetical protein HYZ90_06240 [Candidatus Omnitrophica bacterium]|nr:hypothetical protein [Candidatus Omnitrophota bacterium]